MNNYVNDKLSMLHAEFMSVTIACLPNINIFLTANLLRSRKIPDLIFDTESVAFLNEFLFFLITVQSA
jgi:hypothetical protein